MTTRRAMLALCMLLPPVGAGAQEIPYVLRHLELDVWLDYPAKSVRGSALLRIERTRAGGASVPLLLNRLMIVRQVTDVRGTPVPFDQQVVLFQDDSTRQVNAITLRVPGAAPQAPLGFRIDYEGVLVGYTETGSLYIRDAVDSAFTILREDALAFPVLGTPSLTARRGLERRPFTFRASVTAPRSQVVAAGGTFQDTVPDRRGLRWTYASDAGVPFLNITVAPYGRIDHPGGTIFHFPQDSSGAREVAGAVGRASRALESMFGSLPQRPSLTIMEIPEGYGSQADAVAGVIQAASAFRDRLARREVYHELTHLWNAPDKESPSPRWNEGLASFLEYRLADSLDGTTFLQGMDVVARRTADRCAANVACAQTPLRDFGVKRLTDYSYSVGHAFFFSLFATLGADRFDRAYRSYFQQHARTGGTLAALRAAFVREDVRAERVFTEWVDTSTWLYRLRAGDSLGQVIASYRSGQR